MAKYTFIKDWIQSVCIKMKANDDDTYSPCFEYKHYNYKIGDVIEYYYNGGGLVGLPIKEQNTGVPIYYFQKVSDNTPLSKENISFSTVRLTSKPVTEAKVKSDYANRIILDAKDIAIDKSFPTKPVNRFPEKNPSQPIDMDLLNKQYQDALNEQKAINQQNNLTSSTNVAPQTFLEKNKTNLLIVGVLVLGYLAYKKFNK